MSKKLSKEEIKVVVDVIIKRKDEEIKNNYKKEYSKEIEEFNIIKKEIEEKYLNLEKEYKLILEEYENKNIKDNNFRIYMRSLEDVRKNINWNSSDSMSIENNGYCFDKNRNLKYDDNLRIKINNELVLNNIKNDVDIEKLINEFVSKIKIK